MKVIKKASTTQITKKEKSASFDAAKTMKVMAASCSGECYDCDSCGGSITH